MAVPDFLPSLYLLPISRLQARNTNYSCGSGLLIAVLLGGGGERV